ncbi:Alginate lyase [Lachnellula suecica]|uniref:Alginate lyase n=1 Tax=Lachnellula suecica TaxID=602035 RepID=A0A8T9C5D6_9HELO|nr:Alginate lyase [Lachnellula suecica]
MPSLSKIAHLALFALAANAVPVADIVNASCAPGGNFDLSPWTLQLPTGKTGSPDSVSSSQLAGCKGYTSTDFYTNTDGSLVTKVPGSPKSAGCVTTKNSLHCRTELRESSPSSWDPNAATNSLTVKLAVITADDSARGTVVGQIHIDDSISSKPVCELYYNQAGKLSMGVEQTRAGGDSKYTDIGTVAVGKTFEYVIKYEKNVLSVSLDNATGVTLPTFSLDAPKSYFKVGNYNQGDSKSEVHFFDIAVQH